MIRLFLFTKLLAIGLTYSSIALGSLIPVGIPSLEETLQHELELINYPGNRWRLPDENQQNRPCYDVAIIGGGVGGCTAAFALNKLGIVNIHIFDENLQGYEGPWDTYARMLTLRSDKDLIGPALFVPSLTFRAWYEAQNGELNWQLLKKIPTHLWMDYLRWYRKVLQLPVTNETKLVKIIPVENCFKLIFDQKGKKIHAFANKVVLATGRTGFGGCEIPDFIEAIPEKFYAHSSEELDFSQFQAKAIAVIGYGASGWDAAGVALERGAAKVDLIMRRDTLPHDNGFTDVYYPGFHIAFSFLPDEKKAHFIYQTLNNGVPPPREAIEKATVHDNFKLLSGTTIQNAYVHNSKVKLITNQGEEDYDFILLATGFCIDCLKQSELSDIVGQIQLWGDRPIAKCDSFPQKLKGFPYLGKHFEFLEKEPGQGKYANDIYCFNYASILSQGGLSIDILGISLGAMRLAEGIAADFYAKDADRYYKILQNDSGLIGHECDSGQFYNNKLFNFRIQGKIQARTT